MTPEPSPPTELPESPSAQTSKRKPHLGLILLCLGASLILTRYLTRKPTELKIPGPARGDLVLVAGDLPESLGTWKQLSFEPAPDPERLPKEQYWWSQSWSYSNGTLACSVSFDQANFEHWHDLTVCYQALGWIVERQYVPTTNEEMIDWPCVVVQFRNGESESALLVFSHFFDDGDPVDAGSYISRLAITDTIANKLTSRLDRKRPRTSRVSTTRQCQVFAVYSGNAGVEHETDVIDLHLETRTALRSRWLAHRTLPLSR